MKSWEITRVIVLIWAKTSKNPFWLPQMTVSGSSSDDQQHQNLSCQTAADTFQTEPTKQTNTADSKNDELYLLTVFFFDSLSAADQHFGNSRNYQFITCSRQTYYRYSLYVCARRINQGIFFSCWFMTTFWVCPSGGEC